MRRRKGGGHLGSPAEECWRCSVCSPYLVKCCTGVIFLGPTFFTACFLASLPHALYKLQLCFAFFPAVILLLGVVSVRIQGLHETPLSNADDPSLQSEARGVCSLSDVLEPPPAIRSCPSKTVTMHWRIWKLFLSIWSYLLFIWFTSFYSLNFKSFCFMDDHSLVSNLKMTFSWLLRPFEHFSGNLRMGVWSPCALIHISFCELHCTVDLNIIDIKKK